MTAPTGVAAGAAASSAAAAAAAAAAASAASAAVAVAAAAPSLPLTAGEAGAAARDAAGDGSAREPGESGAADAARPHRAGAGAAAARLDIRSAEFDAAAALLEDAVLPLDVFPLENLARARALLPEWHPDHVRPRASGGPPSGAASVRAEISSMLREERARTKAAYVCPLDALVGTFTAGPLGALRAMCEGKERVRVSTRRVDGVRGTVTGMLRAFDRHWNLLLLDAEEEFRIVEYAEVSADGSARPLQGRVARFMSVYCPDKVANSGAIAAKYRGNEGELWAFLQQKYGLLARVQTAVGTPDKAREQLSRYAGREPVLMAKLGIAELREEEAKFGNAARRDLDDDDDVARAEWIRKPSEKYPGRFFYYNTRTRKSEWSKPQGVQFKVIKYLVTRRRHLSQTLLRGDCVIMCQRAGLPGATS